MVKEKFKQLYVYRLSHHIRKPRIIIDTNNSCDY